MTTALSHRIDELRTELQTAKGAEKARLLERLEEAVLSLTEAGGTPPCWAREALAAHHEEEVEELFDNMPL